MSECFSIFIPNKTKACGIFQMLACSKLKMQHEKNLYKNEMKILAFVTAAVQKNIHTGKCHTVIKKKQQKKTRASTAATLCTAATY